MGKRPGTTYCLGCKDYTHNFRPQEVKMTNKMFREKSNCMVCWSNKSRFLKQKDNNKNNLFKLENMPMYCKNCKKTYRQYISKKNLS